MNNQSSNGLVIQEDAISASVSKPVQLGAAFLLGFVLLFGAVFVQTSAAHNASHDVRHSQAFPCH